VPEDHLGRQPGRENLRIRPAFTDILTGLIFYRPYADNSKD